MTSGKCVDDLINILIQTKLKKKEKGLFNYGQDIVIAFSPPVVGCLVKKGLQKGVSRAPQDPSLATPKTKYEYPVDIFFFFFSPPFFKAILN